ncbi:MAG: ABC transporter permease [Rhodospirillales bacterium]
MSAQNLDATPALATARGRRRPRLSRGWLYVLPAGLWTLLFFLIPLAVMALHSLDQRKAGKIQPGPTTANYEKFFEKDYLLGTLVNSLELTGLTVLFSTPLAFALAAVIAYLVPRRWQIAALVLAVLPFWTSYIVRSYSWLLLLSERGILNSLLIDSGLIGEPLTLVNSRLGVLIVMVHYFMMIMTLTIYVNLRQIPANYLRAARDLGAGRLQILLRVILPLSLPGIMVGVFLTVVFAIGDYVTPQIIGGNREMVMPQAIMLQIGRLANTPMAAALAFILMLVVALAVVGFRRWIRMQRL